LKTVEEYDCPAWLAYSRPALNAKRSRRDHCRHANSNVLMQPLSVSGWLIIYYRCSRLALATAKIALRTASALFLLGLSLLLLPQTHQLLPSVRGSTRTIHLVGYYPAGWNSSDPTITVQQGGSVTIDLSSGDGAPHQFLLDLDRDGISDQSNCPPNSSPTDDPCSMTFSGSGTTSVTFTANSAGTFKYYCTIHYPYMEGTFIVKVPGFSMSTSPSSLGVIQGSSSNSSTITLTSLNGFSGTITLGSTVSQAGLNLSFNPTTVTFSAGGSGTSTMTVSTSTTPPGFYTVTINGMSGSTTNTTTVDITVTIPDFNIKTSFPSLSVTQGSTATTIITLTSLSGFKGALTLTGTVSQPGPTITFSSTSVTLSSGGIAISNMTVSAAGGTYPTATGSYPVTVTVTNGTLTHSTTVEVTVGSITSGTGTLPLTVFIGVAVAMIAVAGAAIYLLRRRTGQTPPSQ